MKSTRSTPAWAADYIIGPGDHLGIEVWFGDDPGSGLNRHKPGKGCGQLPKYTPKK